MLTNYLRLPFVREIHSGLLMILFKQLFKDKTQPKTTKQKLSFFKSGNLIGENICLTRCLIVLCFDLYQNLKPIVRPTPEGAGRYFLIRLHNGPLRTALPFGSYYPKEAPRHKSQVGPEPWVYRVSGRSLTPLCVLSS